MTAPARQPRPAPIDPAILRIAEALARLAAKRQREAESKAMAEAD